jgi:hypothetical protein
MNKWYSLFNFSAVDLNNIQSAFASSPLFTRKVFKDDISDWVNCPPPNTYICYAYEKKKVNNSTDIIAASYHSNGRYLNATIWLNSPLDIKHPYPFIGYGFIIDTNLDGSPPSYLIEANKAANNPWRKVDMEYEPVSNIFFEGYNNFEATQKFLHVDYNYSKLLKDKTRYVSLSLDLDEISLPKQYQVLFYTKELRGNLLIFDFTKWISIPPPRVSLSLNPNTVNIRPDEDKIIDLFVNSTSSIRQRVNLYTNQSDDFIAEFQANKEFNLLPYEVRRIPLNVSSYNEGNLTDSNYPIRKTLLISATSTPPPISNDDIPQENTTTKLVLSIDIDRPLTYFESFLQSLSDFNNKVIDPISGIWTFVLGVLTISIPWAIRKVKKSNKKRNRPSALWGRRDAMGDLQP